MDGTNVAALNISSVDLPSPARPRAFTAHDDPATAAVLCKRPQTVGSSGRSASLELFRLFRARPCEQNRFPCGRINLFPFHFGGKKLPVTSKRACVRFYGRLSASIVSLSSCPCCLLIPPPLLATPSFPWRMAACGATVHHRRERKQQRRR